MYRLKLLSATFLVLLLIPACSRRGTVDEAPELSVEMQVSPSPPNPGPSQLMIRIQDPSGAELGEFTLDLRGDMSHAGMKPMIVEDAKGEAGTFIVPFEWTMAGDWYITIRATLADGRTLLRTLPVRVEP